MSITQLGLTGTPSKQYSVSPKRAATTVTKSIGTSSRDYSTMTAWEADLDNTLVYVSGDDAVGECYNDSTFDESVAINGGLTVGLNTFTLTAATGEGHDGTAGTGVRIVNGSSPAGVTLGVSSLWDTNFCTISDIEIDRNGYGIANSKLMVSAVDRCYLFRMLLHGSLDTGNGTGTCVSGFQKFSAVSNNIIYDLKSTASSDEKITGIGMGRAGFTSYCYNNTVFDLNTTSTDAGCVIIGIKNVGGSVSNNISMDCTSGGGSADDFTNIQTGNNLSSDSTASGTGSLTNKTAANQFVSIVSGSEDLHLKAGSDAIGAGTDLGTTPDGVQYDIDGFDRDAANRVWDIGADQAAGTVGKTIGTSSRDYSTMTLWEADLDDTTIYQSGDDAVGECYNDSTFTIGADITIARTDLSSMTLKAADGEGHDGTSGTGVVINTTAPNHIRYRDAHVPLIVERIELAGSTIAIRTNRLATYKRMLIHNSGSTFATEGGQEPATLMNSIIYTATTGPSCLGHKNYNNTIYNMTNDGVSGAVALNGGEVKNTISVGNGGEDFDTGTAQTESYCMSSDTTASGTGSITSVVTADQFVSIVSGSEDLHLKAGADAIGAGVDLGTTPDGVQYDIDGFDRDAANRVWDIGADQAAATITKTIGTTARDYSTMTLWEADLDDTTVYQSGDDAVGECYNDSAFDETISVAGTLIPDTATLTAANGEKHDGTAGTGVRNVQSVYSGHRFTLGSTGLTTFTLSDIEFDKNGITTNGSLPVYSIGGSTNARYHRLLIHNGTAGSVSTGMLLQGTTGYDLEVLNNIVYDIGGTSTGVYHVYGINCPDNTKNPGIKQLNNTVFNITSASTWLYGQCIGIVHSYGSPVFNSLCKNNICMGTSAPSVGGYVGDFAGSTGTHISHNLSSDSTASGTGSLTNKAAVDQFVSIVGGSEDLHLKAGADAIGTGVDLGTTPAGVEIDIDGRDRDAEGDTWSIGADQFVEILYRHFFTRLGLRATPQAYWFWEGSRTVSEEEEGSKGKNFFIFFY